MTQILCYGSIFNQIRPQNKFFHCPMCIGFHVGILIYILMGMIDLFIFPETYFALFIMMFLFANISSGTSYILCQIVDDEGIRINENFKK